MTNRSGLSVHPSGTFDAAANSFQSIGSYVAFTTSDELTYWGYYSGHQTTMIQYDLNAPGGTYEPNGFGTAIRCVKD